MNKWIGVGRLTKDPEIRVTQEQKSIGRIIVAINRNRQDADFISCIAFDKKAELLEKYFRKGDRIGIVGSIRTGSYKNRDGQTVYTTDVMVDEIEFLQDKKQEPRQATFDDYSAPEDVDDADLPF